MKNRLLIAAFVVCAFLLPYPAAAENIIRDAEIENDLKDIIRPVFDQAGIGVDDVRFVVVDSPEVNAFVAGGMNMFIYTGLIFKTENVGELAGVMAHETGHIALGHLSRLKGDIENASLQTVLSSLLGVAAAITTGNPGAGAAVIQGGRDIAMRRFLGHSRANESAADQSGVNFLKGAGQSPRGMESFLEKLAGQELLPENEQSRYVRTHPLSQDRVEFVKHAAEQSPYADTPFPADAAEKHARIKAKLKGFMQPDQALRVKGDRTADIYGRAIAYYKKNEIKKALGLMDQLIEAEPDNPYFHELKGQILFEMGQVKASVAPYQRAVGLLPGSGLIRMAYGHALLESQSTSKAIDELNKAERSEPKIPSLHRLLATAYGRIGNTGMVHVHLAEEALLQNRLSMAKQQAKAALNKLEKGSPGVIKAKDILSAASLKDKDDADKDQKKN